MSDLSISQQALEIMHRSRRKRRERKTFQNRKEYFVMPEIDKLYEAYKREVYSQKIDLSKFARPEFLSLKDDDFLHHPKYRELQSRADWTFVDDRVKMFSDAFVRDMARMGIPIFPVEAFRTLERQNQLYLDGFSKIHPSKAPHPKGLAVDIVHAKKFWNLTEREWVMMGYCAMNIANNHNLKIRWGGDWNGNGLHVLNDQKESFWDPAHYELALG